MSELPEISNGLVSHVAAVLAGMPSKEFKTLHADVRREHRRKAKSVLKAERKFLSKKEAGAAE